MSQLDDTTTTTTAASVDDGAEPMIRLDKVSKVYPDQEIPAVDTLSLDIARGEVLVLVGPSGCGKSTTLRLINRMIEPSSGRIIFDGEDVTSVNPDLLRRRIGYVIQQIGLFPHMTIADNVATVPRLLGWKKDKIRSRVDELLDMVGLEPNLFRDRFPKELSGGQAQRCGVARALGADPEVLLMDEPFGAIDPITRDRLQNEFLRLQSELKKTIVFVTHDIDEAMKMGDRIAILKDRSQIAQLDKPEHILAYPVDDFIDDFIGSGSTLKGLSFERVRDLELAPYPTIRHDAGHSQARRVLDDAPQRWLLVLDEMDRPLRWVNESHLDRTDRPLRDLGHPVRAKVEPNATLHDTLEAMLTSMAGCACVIDKRGSLQGVVEIEALTDVIRRLRTNARKHYEEGNGTPTPSGATS